MRSKNLPIGYWIKQVDELLTKRIDGIQSSFDLTRTEWQVLNLSKEKGPINRLELATLIKPFADLNSFNTILAKFEDSQLLEAENGKLTLTGKGIELHKACFEKQKVFRQKAMAGISEQQ